MRTKAHLIVLPILLYALLSAISAQMPLTVASEEAEIQVTQATPTATNYTVYQPENGRDTLSLSRQALPAEVEIGEETEIQVLLSAQAVTDCAALQSVDVILVVDVSGSMDDEGKIAAAQDAARQFIAGMNLQVDRVALVAFAKTSSILQPLSQEKDIIQQSIDKLSTHLLDSDGTNMALGLRETQKVLANHLEHIPVSIILLSDGRSNDAESLKAATEIKDKAVRLFTISLGQNADQDLMAELATNFTDHYHAPNAEDLLQIYNTIHQKIQQSAVTDVQVSLTYDNNRLRLLPDTITPQAKVDGHTLTWSLPWIEPATPQILQFRVQALKNGQFSASPSAYVTYTTCGDQLHTFTQGEGAPLTITQPTSPLSLACEADPLSNACMSTHFCPGPLILPCSSLGLPWWVCVILLLLLLLAAWLWWQWQKREKHRSAMQQQLPSWPSLLPLHVDTTGWTPLHSLDMPPLLSVTSPLGSTQPPTRTLVIGVGACGDGVIKALQHTLTETHPTAPQTIRWIAIDTDPNHDGDPDSLRLSITPQMQSLLKQLSISGDDLPETRSWFPTLPENPDAQNSPTERRLKRLSLFTNLQQVKEHFAKELQQLQQQPGEDITVYLVSSLAEPTGSSLLCDLSHLIRLQGKAQGISQLNVQAILFLPETHLPKATLDVQNKLYQTAAAAWRELNRFQLVFDRPYPLNYLDQKTIRKGKLFERVYLIGPERQEGTTLANTPLDAGLYPAIADVIVGLSDPLLRRNWEEIARATDNRLNEKQQRLQEPLYGSIGSFTYILPVEELLESLALRFTDELITALRASRLENPKEAAFTFAAQAISHTGVQNTHLIQSITKVGNLTNPEAVQWANERGLALCDWLNPISEAAQQKNNREDVQELATVTLKKHILTSDVMRAPDYNSDTRRVLEETDKAFGRIEQVNAWLNECQTFQVAVFTRLLDEHLVQLLRFDSLHANTTGPTAALDLLNALDPILQDYLEVITASRTQYAQMAYQAHKETQEQRRTLEAAWQSASYRHPEYKRAILQGIVPAAGLVLALGLLSLALPIAFSGLGMLAIVTSGVGVWLSHKSLFKKASLIRQQQVYLEIAQEQLNADVLLALYEHWESIAAEWLEKVRSSRQTFSAWDESITLLQSTQLNELHKPLNARRAERNANRVRRYLDDETLEATLYQSFFTPKVYKEARERLIWQRSEDGEWLLTVSGAQTWTMNKETMSRSEQALLNLARAYASQVRALHIADIMARQLTTSEVAREAGPASAPLINIWPHMQPESEEARLVGVHSKTQLNYFEEVLHILRRPVAQAHTEQLTETTYPYRCSVLAFLNVLRPSGLQSWETSIEMYSHLSGNERAALHIFPAEVHAARWEALQRQSNLNPVILSPSTCLVLENESRALALWRAVACGWVREREVQSTDFQRNRILELKLPECTPVILMRTGEAAPSWWDAAMDFVLSEPDEQELLAKIKTAWNSFIHPSDKTAKRAAVDALEEALRQAAQWRAQSNQRLAELGILLHIVAEDGLNRLYNEPSLFED